MPAINWSTVWTAGATALFVTLAIEYAAKPRLEARKEEILEALRARRQVKTLVLQMTLAAQRYGIVLPTGVDPELEKHWKTERDRHHDTMVERARQLSDGFDLYAGTYRAPLRDLITDVAFTLQGITVSLRQRRRKAEMIAELGTSMIDVLNAPAPWKVWRYLQWSRAVEDVRQLVARAQDEAEQQREGAAA